MGSRHIESFGKKNGGLSVCCRRAGIRIDPDVDDGVLEDVANRMEGMSGREVEKGILGVQSAMFSEEDASINADGLLETIERITVEQRGKWDLLENKVAWS